MFTIEFWSNFISNGLATLIAGTILGGFITWIVSRALSRAERLKNKRDQDLKLNQKILLSLNLIKEEVSDIIVNLIPVKNKVEGFNALREFPDLFFDISYWEVLKTGSDIPSLFDPTVLKVFTNFYSRTNQCNTSFLKLFEAVLANNSPLANSYIGVINKNLQNLENLIDGFKIELIVDKEIKKTEEKIKILSKDR